MGCLPCFGLSKKEGIDNNSGVKDVANESFKDRSAAQSNNHVNRLSSDKSKSRGSNDSKREASIPKEPTANIAAQTFTFRELAAATKNFRSESLIGEGGFGRVYKGRLESTGQMVAVKQLDRNGLQGNREFLVEVLMLSLLHHPNLVNLIGYCADGDQRLLVYEYMPLGSLEDHSHDLHPDKEPLDWNTRMKIAAGAAKGLEYLHDKANPPSIYRDLKSSNILLDNGYFPKLSDFGLAKLGPVGDKTHVSTRVMGTYGYCAPEYAMTGQLTLKSDVYSFGVVFLEIITGRKAIDNTKAQRSIILLHGVTELVRPLHGTRMSEGTHLMEPTAHMIRATRTPPAFVKIRPTVGGEILSGLVQTCEGLKVEAGPAGKWVWMTWTVPVLKKTALSVVAEQEKRQETETWTENVLLLRPKCGGENWRERAHKCRG